MWVSRPVAFWGVMLAVTAPERIASLVVCNTPATIPTDARARHALGTAGVAEALLEVGVSEWCMKTLGSRIDEHRALRAFVE